MGLMANDPCLPVILKSDDSKSLICEGSGYWKYIPMTTVGRSDFSRL